MLLIHTEATQRRRRGIESLSRGSVQVRGESLYYEASGSPEDGPTVLFLHESGGTAATWQQQLLGLAPKARCLAVDLPGHGRSEGKGFPTVSQYRRVISDFLDALAIQWPVLVVGACLGASVAADLATEAPQRVQGLVLAGVSEGSRAAAQSAAMVVEGEAHDRLIEQRFSQRVSGRLVGEHMNRWRLTSPLVRRDDLMAVATYDIVGTLRGAHCPTLLVAGREDPLAGTAWYGAMAEEMVDACMIEIPDAGSLSMAEQPTLFNRAVLGFINGLVPTAPVMPGPKPGGYRRY